MVLLGKLTAWALIIGGLLRAAMGFFIARYFVEREAYEAATARYLGSTTSGEAIDQGLIAIAIGVAFGLLAHIASKSSKPSP